MTRRRWWLMGIVTLLVLVRAALPEIVRRQAETRVSELLHARVQIGDVDLGLLRGMVALENVALRPALPPDAAPDAVAKSDAEPPVVGWKRFAVNLRWWALVRKTVRLSDVELDEPSVALDRLADGALNLLAFVPAAVEGEQPAEPERSAETAKPWGAGIDHLVLRSGRVRFRDFAVQGEGEPVDVGLPTIEVRDVALASGVYGGPARTSVDVRVDEGRLRVNTRLWLRDGGVALATRLRARRMPLERVRLYVPNVGWRELEGELGASLVHHLESSTRNVVTGVVTLDDVAVHVPDVEQPALTWKHFAVVLDAIDLEAHRAAVDSVELAGASVVVRPRGGAVLPAIGGAKGKPAPPGAPSQPAPPGAPAPPPPSEPGAGPPWRWSVQTVRAGDTRVTLLTEDGSREVDVALEAHDLAGDGDRPVPLEVTLAMEGATVALDGRGRIATPGFEGTLTVTDLPLPDVNKIAGALPPALLQGGRLDASLRLAAGSAADPAGDVTIAGTLGLEELMVVGDAPELFSVALKKLDVAVDELRLPRLLLPQDGGARPPPVVKLASIALAQPSVRLTRTPDGLVLPAFSATPATPPPPEGAPSPPPAAAPAASGASAPAPIDLTVAALDVDGGEIRVADRTVKPFFTGGLEALDLDVKNLRYPALTMDDLRLQAKSITRGTLQVAGKRTASGARLEVNGKDIALQPFNPYATHYSPYSISGGALTITTKATMKGSAYDSTTAVKLDRFGLGGTQGESLFKQQFGLPIEVALALLRDLQGRISLDVPVAGDQRGTRVNVMTIAAQALRSAIVNAIASPLKLVGAAFGGKAESAAPVPIAFLVGRAEPTSDGEKAIGALGGLLASRPGIAVTLTASPTESDARWLDEQALREELSRGGVLSALGNLAQRGARERVRVALDARAEGKEGPLEPEDAAKLDQWLAERPKAGADELRALAAARLQRVAKDLQEKNGVGGNRVTHAEPGAEPKPGDPVVAFDLGAASGGAS